MSAGPATGWRRAAGVMAISVALAGCATPGPRVAHDPLEPVNRAVFAFNDKADAWILKPIAQGYVNYVPDVLQMMLGNMLSNVADLWTAANQLLQGKPLMAIHDLSRFTLNTTLGFAGIGDVATPMGLEKHSEDFGQTLGRWGLASGPYLVLPIFGPSSVRDGLGFALDMAADPVRQVETEGFSNNLRLTRAIDQRASLLTAGRVVEGAALDKYSFVRDGYLQRRRNQVWDGDPPPEPAETESK